MWGPCRCKRLTAHAMASSATASSSGASQKTDWLSITWQRALQRCDVVDLLKGTNLQPMADDLGFWAYRLDNVFPEDMHNRVVILMHEAFDPRKGGGF